MRGSRTKLNISIPNPCNENWDKMTPEAQGRFCASCQTVVTDFSSMTDEEVLNYFLQHRGQHICGRYLATQLNRPITIEAPARQLLPIKLAGRIAAGFLFLYSLAGTAYAQKGKIKTVISPAQKLAQPAAQRVLKGRVLDEETQTGIAGVRVSVAGTDISAITNKYGRFQLALTNNVYGTIELAGSYADSSKIKTNTVILNVHADADSAAEHEVLMYSYPAEQQDDVQIVDYKIPMIMGGGNGYTGTSIIEPMPVRRYTIWYRLTKPFRKKNRY